MSGAGDDKMFKPIDEVVARAAATIDAEEPAASGVDSAITYTGDVMSMSSLCMACHEQGVTNLLLTRIPFFRDIIIMAFSCDHCGYRSSDVQPAEMQDKGCRFEVKMTCEQDLSRQIVKSDAASVTIPELAFEIPPGAQKGVFTTVEGLLDRALEQLSAEQPLRAAVDPALASAIEEFLSKLRAVREGAVFPFTLVLDDPSGNSFLENPLAPKHDPHMKVKYYTRSTDQNHALGLYAESARQGVTEDGSEAGVAAGATAGAASADAPRGAGAAAAAAGDTSSSGAVGGAGTSAATGGAGVALSSSASTAGGGAAGGDGGGEATDGDERVMFGSRATTTMVAAAAPGQGSGDGNRPGGWHKGGARLREKTLPTGVLDLAASGTSEVMRFPADCSQCSARGECRMCITPIPHFKEVILMAFTCEACGWKDVEVKGGGAVPAKGTLVELYYDPKVPGAQSRDMTRDIIKGDQSSIEIPEVELFVEQGSLGGMYTTVEGLLTALRDKVVDANPFATEEATDSAVASRKAAFSAFKAKMDDVVAGTVPFTLRLRDPMANTWIYSPYEFADPPTADPFINVVQYTRTHEEELHLGLLDMKVEGYGEEETAAAGDGDDDGEEEEEEKGDGSGGGAGAVPVGPGGAAAIKDAPSPAAAAAAATAATGAAAAPDAAAPAASTTSASATDKA